MLWLTLLLCGSLQAAEPCVMGVGEPIIDLIYQIEDNFLTEQSIEKGGSRKVEYSQFMFLQEHLKPQEPKVVPGGCCGNSLKGIARLGIPCRYVGKIGLDSSGFAYRDSLLHYGIYPLLLESMTHTTQLLSLVTPDSQRTMRCCFGASNELSAAELVPEQFEGITNLLLEGYLLFNEPVVRKAIELAKTQGAKISIDLASFEVVRIFKDKLPTLLKEDIDLVFANEDEARALTGLEPEEACYALQKLCAVAVVLVGKEGCYVGSEDRVFQTKPPQATLVDTTGAGDLFASGFLYGYIRGMPLEQCAELGNLLGSTCIQFIGAEIPEEKWLEIELQL